ncbi:MDR/zinc-dependent alcohol dehydrogenase-like family protein [Zooshikella harenae]|uniref:Alcohol dehydrogenase catalytic domain-containing protein n=1 Tax=Zooshikella harenae TaxID=2827238 RepID=A0ABS5ZCQ8_9GAMM|nr:alcohol dehydrogenase catalytic domain-containing protein [Zooshikella harenae]MBU2710712.1 alcohol dehydrogenase catalytic domain-containing protein [Zooshikella harenae]
MKAVLFNDQQIMLVSPSDPEPAPNEALLRPLVAGICQTDIELFNGYYNFQGIPGHECVAEVIGCPAKPDYVGKRVVVDINIGCGDCPACQQNDPHHCHHRQVLGIKHKDGVFAEMFTAPLANLCLVPDNIPDHVAVFTEPLAAALAIQTQLPVPDNTTIAVLGDGKLGLLISLALKEKFPNLVLIGKHPNKLAIAARHGITTELLEFKNTSQLLQQYQQHFSVIVEATGRPNGLDMALALVAPRGTIVLKTTSHQLSEVNLSQLVVNEIKLIGSRCGQMNEALQFMENHSLDTELLIEARYPFQQFQRAFQHALQRGSKKVLIDFPSGASPA